MSEEKLSTDYAGDPIHAESEGMPEERGVNVGLQLRTARESRGVSVEEVSLALKLSLRQVEALEANDWSRLPKTVIRGIVRNYAVLAYYLVPAETWWTTLESIKELVQTKQNVINPATDPANEAGVVTPSTHVAVPAVVAVSDSPELPASPPDAVPLTPAIAEPLPVSASSSSANTLVFVFSQPAWVEVRDRGGQIVFSQLSQAGSRREVNGLPPFSLVVGNASYVTLQYRGHPVDLSKRSKDDVARLTLE